MTNNTLQLKESYEITQAFEACEGDSQLFVVGSYAVESTTSDLGICEVVVLDQSQPREEVLPGHVSLDDLESRLLAIPGMQNHMVSSRPWVADTLYKGEMTLRALRLRSGLTQSQLAAMIGTSQPHMARMERGGGDVMRDTMRKLSSALSVDMNTIDEALQLSTDALEGK